MEPTIHWVEGSYREASIHDQTLQEEDHETLTYAYYASDTENAFLILHSCYGKIC